MKLLPLDSSQWDDSNESKIIKIWSLEPVVVKITSKYLMLREFYIYKMPIWSKKLDYSVNINPNVMKLLSFDSSQWDESNDLKIIKIWSLGPEISIF